MPKSTNERLVEALVRDYRNRLNAGEAIDRASYVAEHPLLAARLQRALGDLGGWQGARLPTQSSPFVEDDQPAPLPVLPGFTVRREIGRGAMGRVVQAVAADGTEVAVKLLHPGLAPGTVQARRLRREALAVKELAHPNIVPVIDSGMYDGVPYLVMPLIGTGVSLGGMIDRDGRLPAREAADMAACIAEALQFAHEHGVVHRDVKPGNVLLDDGHPWLTDFGLAHLADETLSRMTKTGEMVGTLCCMAPEQALGDGKPVPAWDIYALGATLYESLTGQPPFVAEGASALLAAITADEPQPVRRIVPEVPRELEAVCMKCLAKSPADRYQTAGALAADLRRWLNGEKPRASAASWRWARLRRRLYLRRRTIGLGVVGVLLLAGLAVQLGHFRYRQAAAVLVENQGRATPGQPDDVAFLLRAAADSEAEVRAMANRALLRHHDLPRAHDMLLAATGDPAMAVRFHLAQDLLAVDGEWRTELARRLLAGVRDGPAAAAAVRLATELAEPSLTPHVERLAYSDDRVVRQYVLSALSHLLGDQFAGFAATYLRDGPVAGRREVLERLRVGHLPPPFATLVDLAGDPDQPEDLRQSCLGVLAWSLGPRAEDAAGWRAWWQANGDRVSLRRCLVVSWARGGVALQTGDVVWTVNGEPVANAVAHNPLAWQSLRVLRDARLQPVAGVWTADSQRLDDLYLAMVAGRPTGSHPVVEMLAAVLATENRQAGEKP